MTDEAGHVIEELWIADIVLDPDIQIRAALDEEAVDEYTERIRDGEMPPPVRVFQQDGVRRLSRGFHRIAALVKAGHERVRGEVRQGTRRDAMLDCMTANAENGVRLKPEDKQRAVVRLLRDPEWSRWSSRQIARLVRVSHTMVNNERASLETVSSEARPAELLDQGDPEIEAAPATASSLETVSSEGQNGASPQLEIPSGDAPVVANDRAKGRRRRAKDASSIADAEAGSPSETVAEAATEAAPSEELSAEREPAGRRYVNRYGNEATMKPRKNGRRNDDSLPRDVALLLKKLPRHASARRASHRPTVFVVRLGVRATLGYSATPAAHLARILESPEAVLVGAAAGSRNDADVVRKSVSAEFGAGAWRTISAEQIVNAMRGRGMDVWLLENGAHEVADDSQAECQPAASSNEHHEDVSSTDGAKAPATMEGSDEPQRSGSLDEVAARLGRPLSKLELQLFAFINGALLGRFERVKGLMDGRRAFQLPAVDIEIEITAGIKDIRNIKEIVS